VDKVIPECSHIAKIACHKTPTRLDCTSQKCPRKLPCGHNCREPCKDVCTIKCVEIADCDFLIPCGHQINRILCYLKNTGAIIVSQFIEFYSLFFRKLARITETLYSSLRCWVEVWS